MNDEKRADSACPMALANSEISDFRIERGCDRNRRSASTEKLRAFVEQTLRDGK
jgi:hypothetical protein